METKVMITDMDIDESSLTNKQVEVLQFVCDRRTNKEIALMLGISPSAVEQRLQSVRRKFGVHSRADLARAYQKACQGSANLTGEEYQVEHSITDGHNRSGLNDNLTGYPSGLSNLPDMSSPVYLGGDHRVSLPESVDQVTRIAGRIAAVTTAAASIALLFILIVKIAPTVS